MKDGVTVCPPKPRGQSIICRAAETHMDRAQREANARLIAAAPEMVEALEALASAFMSNTRWSGEPPVEVANARAILARINGEPGR